MAEPASGPRVAEVQRETKETQVRLRLSLDGDGTFRGSTGVGFMDHMLELFCAHAWVDLELEMSGDLQVDAHHSLEDLGICLGQALRKAWGDKRGLARYGWCLLPMDEALILLALDLSSRPYLSFEVSLGAGRIGDLDAELIEEFLRALTNQGGITLHVRQLAGKNSHHIAEAIFKGLGRCLRQAVALEVGPGADRIPSTKGVL